MELNVFLEQLFAAAKQAGLDAAEAYVLESESFKAMATNQEITQYSSNLTKGLSFRVKVTAKSAMRPPRRSTRTPCSG